MKDTSKQASLAGPRHQAGRELQASAGTPPAERLQTTRIDAASDAEAVTHWLAEFRASPQTLRTYRREAERLLLWLGDQDRSLAQLRRQDLDAYEAFLASPTPHHRWVGPPRPRHAADWRPFRGPLSPASRRQSLVILQGMFAWLVEAGWVAHNPFRLMRDKRRRLDNRRAGIERYLELPLWQWLWGWLSRPLEAHAGARADYLWQRRRMIFGFAYLLAPRISEMATAEMDDFFQREGRWWWRVVGKGGKTARIPVPEDMMHLLRDWRDTLGLPPEPQPGEPGAVLRGLDGQRGLGDNQLYRLIRDAFRQAAEALEAEEVDHAAAQAARLRAATPHWLRHTALTHQAQAGVELRYLASTARHARLDTTAQYLHTEDEEWHRQQSLHGLPSEADAGPAEPV
ncbi:tyrosine-type recombinase/integrase [Billgrantia kenyensis]|uniref:Tyrosine-type recombinase/integrase n=1 Tax=Billgrantia kenyensis TaxID=321266 RepID=A0A7W0ACC5_9GAMM|nr:site-specific integrase [Halomonas kenyensis]MBA2777414.1 tyrosine-type recombinase/integrase [Halomonas kenyensis]MCG6660084.1 tyrosine-type recombinase/integrase [Halomonas kenyensis]